MVPHSKQSLFVSDFRVIAVSKMPSIVIVLPPSIRSRCTDPPSAPSASKHDVLSSTPVQTGQHKTMSMKTDDFEVPWVEKYRPTKLDDVRGIQQTARQTVVLW